MRCVNLGFGLTKLKRNNQPEKQYGVTIKTKDNEHLQEIFNAIMELFGIEEEDMLELGESLKELVNTDTIMITSEECEYYYQ